MTARERLIELITDKWLGGIYAMADYLLANGVIVAPMPMAEWLRRELTEHVYQRCMEEL